MTSLASGSRPGKTAGEPAPRDGRLDAPDRSADTAPRHANPSLAVRLLGELDVTKLARAFELAALRRAPLHEEEGNGAAGSPPETGGTRLRRLSLARVAADDHPTALARIVAEQRRRPFEPAEEIPVRALLVELGPRAWAFSVVADGRALDESDLGALVHDLGLLYAGESLPKLVPPPTLDPADVQDRIAHWRRRLDGAPPLLDLPRDRVRPATAAFGARTLSLSIDARHAAALDRGAAEQGATLEDALTAAVAVFAARHTRDDDVVLGLAPPARGATTTPLVPLRVAVARDRRFLDLVATVRDGVAEAAENALPVSLLAEALALGETSSHHPIFQVALSFGPPAARQLSLADVDVADVALEGQSVFDLDLAFWRDSAGVAGSLTYSTALFDEATAGRLGQRLVAVVEAAAADPRERTSRLELLADAERDRLLVAGSGPADARTDLLLHEVVETQAAATPNALALVDGTRRVTYGELEARANRLARLLVSRGVGPEATVGVSVGRTVDLGVCFLAVLKAGGAYLPLDPASGPERLARIVDDARPRVVLTNRTQAGALPLGGIPTLFVDELAADLSSGPADPPATDVSPSSLAYVIYTSGSTGTPKGVELVHAGASNLALSLRSTFELSGEDRVAFLSSLSFDASIWELLMALGAGAALCFVETADRVPAELAADLRALGVTVATFTPSLLRLLDAHDLPALRLVIAAGEQCPTELVRAWGVGRAFVNAYGPTETTVCASYARCDPSLATAPPIGRPLPNLRVYVLDEELNVVPPGVAGELYVGGAALGRGYRNRPGATASAFVPDPFGDPGGRLYRTGDLVRWLPSAELQHVGRTDEQVKVRGFRVELGEVRQALLRHRDVSDAIVVSRDGPTGPQLVAYLVLTDEARRIAARTSSGERSAVYQNVHEFLEETLPPYMVPHVYAAVDTLPLTATGKVDVAALPAPEAVASDGDGLAEPETPTEAVVARIWMEHLGLERIGRDDNFLEVGGHSLVAAQVIADVRDAFSKMVPVRLLFESPVLSEFAAAIDEQGG